MRTLILFAFLLIATARGWSAPDSATFASRLLSIYQRQDLEAYLALVEFHPTTPDHLKAQTRLSFEHDSAKNPVRSRLEGITDADGKPYERDGVRYVPTLKPLLRVVIEFDDPATKPKLTASSLLVGIKDGEYRIASVRAESKKPNDSEGGPESDG